MATKRQRDWQRSRVYKWERAHFGEKCPELTLDECRELVSRTAQFYPGFLCPEVTDGRGRRKGGYCRHTNTIKLPRFTRTHWYACHEIAHAIVAQFYDRDGVLAAHGVMFVSVYINVLAKLKISEARALRRSAEYWKVKHI